MRISSPTPIDLDEPELYVRVKKGAKADKIVKDLCSDIARSSPTSVSEDGEVLAQATFELDSNEDIEKYLGLMAGLMIGYGIGGLLKVRIEDLE